MKHPMSSWFDPDKLIKTELWNDMQLALPYVKGKLLDIGCGIMPYKSLFLPFVTEYIGIDKHNALANIKKDFLKTIFPMRSFDTILSTQVIEHVPDPDIFLFRIKQIIKKHGILILTAPLIAALHEEPNDYFRFTKYALMHIFKKNGFRIILIKEECDWFSSNATMIAFHLEQTCNRFFLRYPKKLFVALLLYLAYLFGKLPKRFTKKETCPLNYFVIAESC